MGSNVIQCLDCEEFNWANAKMCQTCGSKNLTISFAELYELVVNKFPIIVDSVESEYMPFLTV